MDMPSQKNLAEMQGILGKMPLSMCVMTINQLMGVQWRDVSRAVRNARLSMTPGNVARIIRLHVARNMTNDELAELVSQLRLYLAISRSRAWHMVKLQEPNSDDMPVDINNELPKRISRALVKKEAGRLQANVETVSLGEFVYLSVQLISAVRQSSVLYGAIPPGEDLAFFSALSMRKMLRACVEGLGYQQYEDAYLHGPDLKSLLRIYYERNPNHLTNLPLYDPKPVQLKNGIDYTHKVYDENYVNNILGPSPPLLTNLTIEMTKPFFDSTKWNRVIEIKFVLKSSNIAETLKKWVLMKALAPVSDFFIAFQDLKSNRVYCNEEE